jgi:hypothetical protein
MQESVITVLQASSQRGLSRLLIGGNAIIMLGYIRTTADLDLMVPASQRSRWLDLMRELGWKLYNATSAFAQFEASTKGGTPVDLMFVSDDTWDKIIAGAREMDLAGEVIQLPKPEFLIALKLHAASSATRSKPETDWEDIRQIIRICKLDPEEPAFRTLILRYGGESALERIKKFPDWI